MTVNERSPIFVALEGGDGAGKSTQAQLLIGRLRQEGIPALGVQEPGTTPLGEHLRAYLKSKQRIEPEAELLLFEASRAQLVSEVIIPGREQGLSIVADRFTASSIAYQGYGRLMGKARVKDLNEFASQRLQPDLNILLDLPPQVGLERARAQAPAETARFESQPGEFHIRVREGYLARVSGDPQRWAVIDATMTVDRFEQAIWERVRRLL